MKLNDFKTLKTNLLKKWEDGKKFELYYLKCLNAIKLNLSKTVNFTAGAKIESYESLNFKPAEFIEDLFGLPYTDTSDFAAVWNTNTQAETKYLSTKLYFRAAAINEDIKAVLIFEDENENYYYFEDYDFLYFTQEQEKNKRAEQIAEFTKDANKAVKKVVEVLKQYTGKPYGPKTSEKIYVEIHEKTKDFNFNQIYFTNNNIYINKYITGGRVEHNYYFNAINKENKIEITEEPKEKEIFNPDETMKRRFELKNILKEKSAELLKLVNEYNKINQLLHTEDGETQVFNYQLRTVAEYGIRE